MIKKFITRNQCSVYHVHVLGIRIVVIALAVRNWTQLWTTLYFLPTMARVTQLYYSNDVNLVKSLSSAWLCITGLEWIWYISLQIVSPDEIYFFLADKNTRESLKRMIRMLTSKANPKAEVRWWKSLILADLKLCFWLWFWLPGRLIRQCLWAVDTCQNTIIF